MVRVSTSLIRIDRMETLIATNLSFRFWSKADICFAPPNIRFRG